MEGSYKPPHSFFLLKQVVDLIRASTGAWRTSPTCQRCGSQSKEGWQALDMCSTDTKQSNQGTRCDLKLLPRRWNMFSWRSWSGQASPPRPSPAWDSPPVLEDPTSTLKHNLEYLKHQWKLVNYDAMRCPKETKCVRWGNEQFPYSTPHSSCLSCTHQQQPNIWLYPT